MKNYLLPLLLILFASSSFASDCSTPSKEVMELLTPLIQARVVNGSVETKINQLRSNKSESATEALVRAKSIYWGSWPGTLVDCEIDTRAMASLPFLENPSYCLDGTMVEPTIISDVRPFDLNIRKKRKADWIRNGGVGSCEFE